MSKILSVSLIVVTILSLSLPCSADSIPDPAREAAIREAERVQRWQQEQLNQQRLRDAEERGRTPSLEIPDTLAPAATVPNASLPQEAAVPAPTGESPSGSNATCWEIRELAIVGAPSLADDVKDALVRRYVGRCLTVTDIERLLGEVLKTYMDLGYIAARPYVSAQDISAGKLEILVVEGKVEKVILNDRDRNNSINIGGAFPLVVGRPLNLRDIEQGLDQINRLSSNKATMDVLPGTGAGDSVVTVSNNASFPLRLSLSHDGLGSGNTGRNQLGVTVSADNPLGINDFITYTRKESLTRNRQQSYSESNSLYYSVPIGYWMLSSSYSHSAYAITQLTPGGDYLLRGISHQIRGQVDYALYRDQRDKLGLSAALNYKSTKTFEFDDELLEPSSFALTVLEIDFSWSRTFGAGNMFNLLLGYSRGMAMFGVLKDNEGMSVPANYPHAQGDKVRYTVGVVIPFHEESKAMFSSTLTGQVALVPLMGAEQFSVGGFYSVRGFDQVSLTGDRGYYVRNEVSADVGNFPMTEVAVRPFVGLDFGYIACYPENDPYLPPVPSGTLVGGIVGLRFNGKHMDGEFSLSCPINAPGFFENTGGRYSLSEEMRTNFMVNIKI